MATTTAIDDQSPSRYVVGVDLGTTNSAVAFVDTDKKRWGVEIFTVPQLVAAGEVEARETLPSFHYQPAEGELAKGALRLPWQKDDAEYAVGVFARDHGSLTPGRLVASAKSWLSHAGVDRTAELLPWHAAADVDRLSPIEVSARYLRHMREAWDARFPGSPLAEQELVLTLPASFDEVARQLTVRAAAEAGLRRVVLIEEPQAAFYAWLDKHAADWEQRVSPGHKILVIDVGGGTSDFTLIRVRRNDAGTVQFHRVAVGEHLILGGDNLDLALAHHLEKRLTDGGKLPPRQWDVLVASCRRVKETLLGDNPPERYTINLAGAGSKLIGGGLQVEITREEVEAVLVDGFLPQVALDAKPASRRSGFQEFGLPFAPDFAITRYLATFLTAHRHVAMEGVPEVAGKDPARPDIVLFNGGFFASHVLQTRLLAVLGSWFRTEADPSWSPLVLEGERLDLAVARGAAYYGMVRRGEGVRISAELARTYYIGVESDPPAAVCLAPASAEPGQEISLSGRRFDLLVSEPVEFPLYISSTRLTDEPGELIPVDLEQMRVLPPIRTVLRARKRDETGRVSVGLHARLSEIGTLELWCAELEPPAGAAARSWRMQFDVRSATQTDVLAHEGAGERSGFLDEATWDECRRTIEQTFGPTGDDNPAGLMKRLAEATGMSRDEWPPTLLRRMWETLWELEAGRRKSQAHESRWLNLLGFALRPGFGLAVDDWRVAETWRAVQGKLAFGIPGGQAEARILWRRICGGLSAGQQQAVADPMLAAVRALHRRAVLGQSRGGDVAMLPHESAEAWRLLGSFELLPVSVKGELGGMLIDLLAKPKLQPVRPALVWALGRLGARTPLYGPLNTVVSREQAADWLLKLMPLLGESTSDEAADNLAMMLLARRTDDRYRDVSEKLRADVIAWLEARGAAMHLIELVRDGGTLDSDEQGKMFGESLPAGLRLA